MRSELPWPLKDVEAWWCGARMGQADGVGSGTDQLVTPASVMKVQVALTVLSAIEDGLIDGRAPVRLDPVTRTPGPVGMSLFEDAATMSVRDLLVPMMTISDNVATDALIELVGIDAVNQTTARLGMSDTLVTRGLRDMLDSMAAEAGFQDYAALARHDPTTDGPPSANHVRRRLGSSTSLDPNRGERTTPADMVRLLQAVWTDTAGSADACLRARSLMRQQLTQNRIASGFGAGYTVAAKSGGLMGIVRNEVGVVTAPSGHSFAVAIFTRRPFDSTAEPAQIDAAIGALARSLVDQLS
jgi:beta-lactamase class A